MTAEQWLLCDDADGVRTLTFNRPEAKNVFNRAMGYDLGHAFSTLEEDDSVRAIVVTGSGNNGSWEATISANGGVNLGDGHRDLDYNYYYFVDQSLDSKSRLTAFGSGVYAPLESLEQRAAEGLRAKTHHAERKRRQGHEALHRLREILAANQHATNFAGARTDFIELGIAPQAAGGVLVGVADAAQGLNGFPGHPGRLFGGVEDGAGGVLVATRGSGLWRWRDICPGRTTRRAGQWIGCLRSPDCHCA